MKRISIALVALAAIAAGFALGQPGDDSIFGHGRVDAFEAVYAAINGLDNAATIDTPSNGATTAAPSPFRRPLDS